MNGYDAAEGVSGPSQSQSRMRPRGKFSGPGWAAFDLKHGQKKQPFHEPQVGDHVNDPFPPMPCSLTFLRPNTIFPARSFSSVLQSPLLSPASTGKLHCNEFNPVVDSSGVKVIEENSHHLAFMKLKHIHGWAKDSLIEDVLASVDGDIDRASTLLKGMVFTANSEQNEGANSEQNEGPNTDSGRDDFLCEKRTAERESVIPVDLATDIADLRSTIEDALKVHHQDFRNDHASGSQSLCDAAAISLKLIRGHLRSIPVEPEWEEDDVYLFHRKGALKMMRTASRHSRAATNAFLRGDHSSSHKYSLKAQEEWLAAERLNAVAASEIFSIRNGKNDPWKLDLHGLHAAEAVQALKEHLQKIEIQVTLNRPVTPNGVWSKKGIPHPLSPGSFRGLDVQNLDKKLALCRPRPKSLLVITGVGNHSRERASLPTAIRSFLNENGYRFYEERQGVMAVQPKFRHGENGQVAVLGAME